MDPRQLETPHRRSARATEIAHLWSRYQANPDERSHLELLRAADQFIRAEAGRMLVNHRYLAEEACQEALLGVDRKIATMEPPEYPAAYIRKILSNRVATLLEREVKRQTREERYWTPAADTVDIDLTATSQWYEFLESLRQAVSDDEFWTLVLHYHFDFSYIEIGELLEKDPGAVRQIALRGRRKCRERMGRLEGRVPAWLTLPDPESLVGWREFASDSADGPRRPPAGSEAGRESPEPNRSGPRWEFPRLTSLDRREIDERAQELIVATLLFLRRWWLGIPTSVLPLVMIVGLPVVAQGSATEWSEPIPAPAAALLAGQPESSGSRGAERDASGADQARIDGGPADHGLRNELDHIADVAAPAITRLETPNPPDTTIPAPASPTASFAAASASASVSVSVSVPPPTSTVATITATVDTAASFFSLGRAITAAPAATTTTARATGTTAGVGSRPATATTAPSTSNRRRPTTTRPSTSATSRRPTTSVRITRTTPRRTTAVPTTIRVSTTERVSTTATPTTAATVTTTATTKAVATTPTTAAPTTAAPSTVSSTTAAPTTAAPTSAAPTTSTPTTAAPTTAPATTSTPSTASSSTGQPTTTGQSPTSESTTTTTTTTTAAASTDTTQPVTSETTAATRPSGPPPGATDN